MKIEKNGIAGTLESGDIMIEIKPSENQGINVEFESTIASLFGRQIKQIIIETAEKCGLENVDNIATDKGSLDCTIRASGGKFEW